MCLERNRATILAALRFWQRHGPIVATHPGILPSAEQQGALIDVATNGGTFRALTAREMDRLCEDLNGCGDAESEPTCCDCQLPGFFCSGVPGIIAHVVHCRLPPGAKVERCDLCQRYPTDEAAQAKLRELGFCPSYESVGHHH